MLSYAALYPKLQRKQPPVKPLSIQRKASQEWS